MYIGCNYKFNLPTLLNINIILKKRNDIFIQPAQLELKRPKSRIYLNETEVGPLEELPFSSYNPRILQEGLEGENLKTFDIIEGCSPQDLWTWNVGYQKREEHMDQEFISASLPKYGV